MDEKNQPTKQKGDLQYIKKDKFMSTKELNACNNFIIFKTTHNKTQKGFTCNNLGGDIMPKMQICKIHGVVVPEDVFDKFEKIAKKEGNNTQAIIKMIENYKLED